MSEIRADDAQKPAQEGHFAKLARAGATIGAIAIIGGLSVVLVRLNSFLQQNVIYGVAGLGLMGLLLVLKPLKIDEAKVENVLHFYQQARFWGFIMMGVAGIVYYFAPERQELLRPPPAQSHQVVRPVPKPIPQEREVEATTPAPPEFPELKVSGLVVNGAKSSAVINSEVVLVGERIRGVTLLEVTNSEIKVEYRGFRKVIPVTLR